MSDRYDKISFFQAATAWTVVYAAVRMTTNDDEIELCDASDSDCIGFTTRAPTAAGDRVPVIPAGLVQVTAEGAIAKNGPFVASTTTPGAVTAAGTSNGKVLGVAIDAIGDTETGYGLVDAAAGLPNVLGFTVGAEAANVIAVTLAATLPGAREYVAHLVDNNGIDSLAANFTMAETGAGAEVSATAQSRLIFSLSAAGAATISVTDVIGASGATIHLFITPLNHAGPAAYTALTFD